MKQIDMIPRSSSNVAATGYDPASQTLAVQFKNGATYHYSGVPQDVADGLDTSASVGKYIHQHIVGVYESSKEGANGDAEEA